MFTKKANTMTLFLLLLMTACSAPIESAESPSTKLNSETTQPKNNALIFLIKGERKTDPSQTLQFHIIIDILQCTVNGHSLVFFHNITAPSRPISTVEGVAIRAVKDALVASALNATLFQKYPAKLFIKNAATFRALYEDQEVDPEWNYSLVTC